MPIRQVHAVGSQNIRHSEHRDNLSATLHNVQKFFPAALDVLAMQELTGTNVAWIKAAMPGWAVHYRRPKAGQNGTGLAWDTDRWSLRRKGLRTIYKPGRDGFAEIYKGDSKPEWHRFAAWATLQDRLSGEVVSFVSIHGKLGTNKAKQWKNLHKLVNELRKAGAVFILGDFNAHYDQFPGWMRDGRVMTENIDHVLKFGPAKITAKKLISEREMDHLVDHPGIALVWNHA